MKVIYGPRKSGRTIELAALVKANNGIMLVQDPIQREYIRKKFGLRRDQVIVYKDRSIVWDKTPVYVDNADFILSEMLNRPLDTIVIEKRRDKINYNE